jgi:hypothetical protein
MNKNDIMILSFEQNMMQIKTVQWTKSTKIITYVNEIEG